MNFLIKSDYLKHIQSDNLEIVTDSTDSLIDECELIAIEEITSFISHRYDTDKIFTLATYSASTDYFVGDVLRYTDDLIYICILDTTGNDPTNTTYWTQTDVRSAKMVSITIDLTLYHLHSRINPRNIPELRGFRRDDAIKWLSDTRDFKNNPSFLPIVESEDGTEGLKIKWDSKTKQKNDY
jgi:hypothetical protein